MPLPELVTPQRIHLLTNLTAVIHLDATDGKGRAV